MIGVQSDLYPHSFDTSKNDLYFLCMDKSRHKTINQHAIRKVPEEIYRMKQGDIPQYLFSESLSQEQIDTSISGEGLRTYLDSMAPVEIEVFIKQLIRLLRSIHAPIANIEESLIINQYITESEIRCKELKHVFIRHDLREDVIMRTISYLQEEINHISIVRLHGQFSLDALVFDGEKIIGITDTAPIRIGLAFEDFAHIVIDMPNLLESLTYILRRKVTYWNKKLFDACVFYVALSLLGENQLKNDQKKLKQIVRALKAR